MAAWDGQKVLRNFSENIDYFEVPEDEPVVGWSSIFLGSFLEPSAKMVTYRNEADGCSFRVFDAFSRTNTHTNKRAQVI